MDIINNNMFKYDISKFTKGSYKHTTVYCQSKISEKCLIEFTTEFRGIYKNIIRNNGTFICTKCANRIKNSGLNNQWAKQAYVDYTLNKKIKDLDIIVEDITKYPRESHINITMKCQYKKSPKCKKITQNLYRDAVKFIINNNYSYMCLQCSRYIKNSGRKNSNTCYQFDDNIFNIIDSQAKAYLLGWIASDGTIRESGFVININKNDIQCLKILRDIICSDIPIKIKKDNMIYLTVNSQQISKDLCKILQLPFDFKSASWKKSKILKYPLIDSQYDIDFIRGYFDGDGCNCISKNILTSSIASDSNEILKSIQSKLLINGNIYSNNTLLQYNLSYSGSFALKFCELLYNNKNQYYLQRKYDKYIYYKNMIYPYTTKKIGQNRIFLIKKLKTNLSLQQIKQKSYKYKIKLINNLYNNCIFISLDNIIWYDIGMNIIIPDNGYVEFIEHDQFPSSYKIIPSCKILKKNINGSIKIGFYNSSNINIDLSNYYIIMILKQS